jgi:hypothetical protein
MSFKYGSGEVKREGRLFNYYNEQLFRELIANFKRLKIIDLWQTEDKREEREGETWFNVLVKSNK